jgi:leucyl-tRNA synthetase
MVCHETYKDKDEMWLNPSEIEKISEKDYVKTLDKSKVFVGPSESMSKSKKNVIDPEDMIKSYGADAVRWFILSDSPPEKDVQWSNQGVVAAYKFLQKVYNLNNLIIRRENKKSEKDDELDIEFNNYISKITSLINDLQLNVVIANVYSVYSLFTEYMDKEVNNECIKKKFTDLMKILIPFVPHLAHECLEQLGATETDEWPSINDKLILEKKIKIAVQINGKTKQIIEIKKNSNEASVVNQCKENTKINDKLMNKKIIKTIYIKNKIINFLVK